MPRYVIALLIFMPFIQTAGADTDEKVRRYTVAADTTQTLPTQSQSAVFEHGELMVTLSDSGLWEVDGLVAHTRFFCGTYQVGARFGRGNPACVNVKWLSNVEYVTSHRQCNSAVMMHKGSGQLAVDMAPETSFDIDKATCAQIHIKCRGTCN